MKIIVSPDSFKGSLDAIDVAHIMKKAILAKHPSYDVQTLPVADGGEGTLEALVQATNGQFVHVTVHHPLHQLINTYYGILGNGVYMIEMAKASGLPLIDASMRNPLLATTYGTGECIRHALDSGARQFVIGIGGSATNDGGLGMLRALGMKFYDEAGNEIIVPRDLYTLAHIDDTQFDARIADCTFTIACDVDNPFVGPNGASAIFGPQKGASEEMVKLLDTNLAHFADVIEKSGRIALHHMRGAGAAGGLGGAFLAFFPATLKSGIDVVLDAMQFDEAIKGADMVITGEGKSDAQTLAGKAPIGILHRAQKQQIKTVLVSAVIEDHEQLYAVFDKMYAVVDGDVTAEMSLAEPEKYLYEKITTLIDTL